MSWDIGVEHTGMFVHPSLNRVFESATAKEGSFTNMSLKSPPSKDA